MAMKFLILKLFDKKKVGNFDLLSAVDITSRGSMKNLLECERKFAKPKSMVFKMNHQLAPLRTMEQKNFLS